MVNYRFDVVGEHRVAELESPSSAAELFRYRGGEVPRTRPIFQGDVFDGIEIPGLHDGAGLAIVLTHACSMRAGAGLRPRLIVARVATRSTPIALPWIGNFRLMPLPDLIAGAAPGHWAANFEDIGVVSSESLVLHNRVACLDDQGLLLLQQRHAHHFTRFVVETRALYEQCANVLAEAELLEEWLTAAIDEVADDFDEHLVREAAEFEAFIDPLRDGLKDPSRRASVRRSVNQEIRRRFD